ECAAASVLRCSENVARSGQRRAERRDQNKRETELSFHSVSRPGSLLRRLGNQFKRWGGSAAEKQKIVPQAKPVTKNRCRVAAPGPNRAPRIARRSAQFGSLPCSMENFSTQCTGGSRF